MKIPLTWLRDYIDITLPPAQLIERLTLAGLEAASIRVLGLAIPDGVRVKAEERGPAWERDKIVTAQVLSVDKHPNADKLLLVTLNCGAAEPKTVVTGAPNLKVGDKGQKVVLGLAGTVYFDGHATPKALKTLEPKALRGIMNDAMVMSEFELGISDEHEGIIILESDAPIGTPLADFMGDIIVEVDVLPNMARCLSMIGVAREVAAITGQKVKYPTPRGESSSPAGEPIGNQVKVEIDNPKLSARYAAVLIKNVSIGPSPGWMQRRLLYAGMRPISNIVDITNFVMLEWGQPLHAFDHDVLVQRAGGKAPTIIVRSARPGEILTTLDGNKRELSPDNLVIADTAGAIALAGVMGGAETEVTGKTRNILLESASFDFVSIRRTMKQFNLPSEASVRFSKGIHPETVKPAALRAVDLMREYAGGMVCQGLVDHYPAPLPEQVVDLKMSEVKRLLGIDFPRDEAAAILRSLEFKIEETGADRLRVVAPPHRLDIQVGPADLIEDLARIHGYDRLPETLLADRLPRQQTNVALVFEERVRDILVGCGLQEVITYALTTVEKEAPLVNGAEYVTLKNPISSERVVMRRSVLAGVLDVAKDNLRNSDVVRLFEVGFVYLPRPGEKLPEEPRRLAIVMSGSRGQEFWGDAADPSQAKKPLDFFDLKGVLESLLEDLHVAKVKFQPAATKYLHPGRSAVVMARDKVLGEFGEMHPTVAKQYSIGERTILVAELDLEALQAALPARYSYTPVARFPAALRDIAVAVPESITVEKVNAEIRAAGGDLLSGSRLFDLYRGDNVGPGTKSLAFALSYQASDRTLTDKEVDKAHKKIEDRLKHVLKATVRGKE